jgi:NADPH:quinone reductase-like Zn-dependent oxidoreductase
LPLALSTAAVGLFQKDQLALKYPTVPPKPNGEALLIWSGSSSVGRNAIQLATTAGYEVFTTASPKNFEYVKRLGAVQAFDYRSPTVIKDIVNALKNKTLVGAMAIDNGSADACISVLEKTKGGKFVALASVPVPEKFPDTPSALAIVSIMASVVRWQLGLFIKTRTKGITTKFILGDSLQNNEVSKVVYEDFLPRALAEGKYVAAPEPIVVGHGLEYIQEGLMFRRKACRRRRWL